LLEQPKPARASTSAVAAVRRNPCMVEVPRDAAEE
jgi:hypothetical protein